MFFFSVFWGHNEGRFFLFCFLQDVEGYPASMFLREECRLKENSVALLQGKM